MNTFPAGWRGRKEHKSLKDTEAVKSKHTGSRRFSLSLRKIFDSWFHIFNEYPFVIIWELFCLKVGM